LSLAEVEVGAAGLNEDLEELVDVGHEERGGYPFLRKRRKRAFCSQRA
jgi:hypothetical protein